MRSVLATASLGLGAALAFPLTASAQSYGETPVPSVLPTQLTTTSATVLGNSATPGSGLPLTGADVLGIVSLAVGVSGVGTALVVASRRRNRAAA